MTQSKSVASRAARTITLSLSTLAALMLSITAAAAQTVGFERTVVADANGKLREVGIWYPSEMAAAAQPLGSYQHTVAAGGPISGRQLGLVMILHGVQGWFGNHYHTALALAEAGFVAAAVTHGPDLRLVDQPGNVTRILEHMLAVWPHRDRIDPARVGIFGFSIGGFAALVAIGGAPDFTRIGPHCAAHPDRVCRILQERNADLAMPISAWEHDARIKAAVIAAPTLGFTFTKPALAAVKAPVQLWRAGSDEITPHPYNAEAVFGALPPGVDYVVVPSASHFAFVACSVEMAERAPQVCRDAPEFDRQAFHATFNSAVVAYFKTRLQTP